MDDRVTNVLFWTTDLSVLTGDIDSSIYCLLISSWHDMPDDIDATFWGLYNLFNLSFCIVSVYANRDLWGPLRGGGRGRGYLFPCFHEINWLVPLSPPPLKKKKKKKKKSKICFVPCYPIFSLFPSSPQIWPLFPCNKCLSPCSPKPLGGPNASYGSPYIYILIHQSNVCVGWVTLF